MSRKLILSTLVAACALSGVGVLIGTALRDGDRMRARLAPADDVATLRCASGTGPAAVFKNRAGDFVLGPLTMPGMLDAEKEPASAWRRVDGTDPGWSTPVFLQQGHSFILRLHPSMRRVASLVYGRSRPEASTVGSGVLAVRFRACSRPHASQPGSTGLVTSWPGSLLVKRRMCVPVDIALDGREAVRIEFGMGRRHCRTKPVALP